MIESMTGATQRARRRDRLIGGAASPETIEEILDIAQD